MSPQLSPSCSALLLYICSGGSEEVFYDFKVQIELLCHPYTHIHTLIVPLTGHSGWDKFMSWVSDTCWWLKMSYTEWVIRCLGARGSINPGLGCVTLPGPSLLLLINSNLPTLCLMQCGSGWPVHCRPLPSVLHSRFNPHLRRLWSGLRATLTPAGC